MITSSDAVAAVSPSSRWRGVQDTKIVSFFTIEMILLVVTQKIAIPLGGSGQVPVAFLLNYLTLLYLALNGYLTISGKRLILFCALVVMSMLSQLGYSSEDSSFSSLALMLMTAAMFVFTVPISWEAYREVLLRFVLLAVAASCLVGLDWGLQLAHLGMPNLERLIPYPLIYQAYNYIQPVSWGSPWLKPNGIFFLETSHASQFIAIGIVVELTLFRNLARLSVLLLGLGATLGGTGMLLLVACVPPLLLRLPTRFLIAPIALAPIVLFVAAQGNLLEPLTKRTTEFSQNSSSGFNRFILPMQWSLDALDTPIEESLFGKGAGSMPKTVNNEEEGTVGYAWPPYTKIGIEYGLATLAVWFAFVLTSVFGSAAPFAVAWAAFFQYEFLNGSLNVPIHTIYCVLLCSGYEVTRRLANEDRMHIRLPAAIRA